MWLCCGLLLLCLQPMSAVVSTASPRKRPQLFPWRDWCMMGRHALMQTATAFAYEESVRSLFWFWASSDNRHGVKFLFSMLDFILWGSCCIMWWSGIKRCGLVYCSAAWKQGTLWMLKKLWSYRLHSLVFISKMIHLDKIPFMMEGLLLCNYILGKDMSSCVP